MDIHFIALPMILQGLFTATADLFARAAGLICRQRQITGAAFAQTLVFRWLAKPTDTIENIADALGISPQALRKRFGPKAVDFLKALIAEALRQLYHCRAKADTLGILDRFRTVVVDDGTTVSLPAELAFLFPGCGGNAPTAGACAVKLLFRYELTTGRILSLTFHAGRDNDAPLAARADDLPPGALYLADMGFFEAARLKAFRGTGKSWITRVPVRTRVSVAGAAWQSLWAWLSKADRAVQDVEARLTEAAALPCRLVALPCPQEVADLRRRKLYERCRRQQKTPSQASLGLCAWTVLATNVPRARLSPRAVWVAYRCRWQIELLFRRAKQICGWEKSRGESGWRVLVELLCKVLGLLVLHWGALMGGGPLSGVSADKLLAKVAEFAQRLQSALRHGEQRVLEVLVELRQELLRIRPQRRSRQKTSTRYLLLNPELAA
jgi:hypothetical protein